MTRSLAESLPPTVTLLSPAPGTAVDSQRLPLFYEARSTTGPIRRVEARFQGRPVEVLEDLRPSVAADGATLVGQMVLAIPPEDGVAELIAHNAQGASEAARFEVRWGGGPDFYKPRLFLLAVGVSDYPSEAMRLRFAAADARAVAAEVAAQRDLGLYREVQMRCLTDGDATQPRVREGLRWLSRAAGQRDVALLFLAGHGVKDAMGDYYFMTCDADPAEPHFSGLGDEDIRKFLRVVAGKTVLFVDTCFSGGLRAGRGPGDSLPDIDRFANELADAESGVVVFASSTGRELSLEDPAWGHGAFSYALLEAVRDGRADFTQSGHVTVDGLGVYVDECVRRLTKNRQHPTMTKPRAVQNYPVFRVRAGTRAE